MDTGLKRGTCLDVNSIMSVTMRTAGSGGQIHSFWAMNSFSMSFCIVPPTRSQDTPCFSATARYMASAAVQLIVIDGVTSPMTINCTASVALAMYLAVAEKQGVSWDRVGGTMQNDMLKEFIAQKEWICPPEPAVRIVTDMIEFTSKHVPRFNPVSISCYHIREAGSTAVQELAFTLADGLAYVEAALARGLDVDSFAPRLSFFFDVHNDFFEEIAKLRAARRLWARYMKERYGAKKLESMRLR